MAKQPMEQFAINISTSVRMSLTGLKERIIDYGVDEIRKVGVKIPRCIYDGEAITDSDLINLCISAYYYLLRQKSREEREKNNVK